MGLTETLLQSIKQNLIQLICQSGKGSRKRRSMRARNSCQLDTSQNFDKSRKKENCYNSLHKPRFEFSLQSRLKMAHPRSVGRHLLTAQPLTFYFSPSLFMQTELSITHTHTHTHTQKKKLSQTQPRRITTLKSQPLAQTNENPKSSAQTIKKKD